ncbi:MAG: hypothetical protein WA970_12380, partial [Gammaproteobacteria bacterium]
DKEDALGINTDESGRRLHPFCPCFVYLSKNGGGANARQEITAALIRRMTCLAWCKRWVAAR